MPTFGSTATDAQENQDGGLPRGSHFNLPVNGYISSISAFIRNNGAGTNKIKFVIYKSNGSAQPTSLMGTTEEVSMTNTTKQTITANFTTPLFLTSGDYWICWISDYGVTGGLWFSYNDTAVNGDAYMAASHYPSAPDPFDYSSNQNFTINIFATYTEGSPSASLSPSSSISPSASTSPSSSASSSISASVSPSASISPSASRSPSASLSPSSSSSPSISPSASLSPSSSLSPSTSNSPSPSPGFIDFTRDARSSLPANNGDLSTVYSNTEVTSVAKRDQVYVPQDGALQYMIHQFKQFLGNNSIGTIMWEGKSTLAPEQSTVYLQIYNLNTAQWETKATNSQAEEDQNFELEAQIDDLTNYKDADSIISTRIYQLAI